MSKTGCCGNTGRAAIAGFGYGRASDPAPHVPPAASSVQAELLAELVQIPAGRFGMGTDRSTFPGDGDRPRRDVDLPSFQISPTTVTVARFSRFCAETGYRTVAEREGWSFVFHLFLPDLAAWPLHPPGTPWWRKVDGACWSAPEGPGSDVSNRSDHPVVHVAWTDALAYCHWAGLRLPSEAEWERAARGGLEGRLFPWGDDMMPGGRHAMNVWQGRFPHENTADDGFVGTAPATAFAPNGFGLYEMTGNVWEWVANAHGAGPAYVQRGGSYLCHASYCDRYHVHSRTWNDADSSTGNCGFRVAASLAAP